MSYSLTIPQHSPTPALNPIFNFSPIHSESLQKSKTSFSLLQEAGIHFSNEQLQALTIAQIKVIGEVGPYLADLKKTSVEFSSEHLLPLSATLIHEIGLNYISLGSYIKAGLEFPWAKLTDFDPALIQKIIYYGAEFAAFKAVGVEFSWQQLISLRAAQINDIGNYAARFIAIKKAGIEFSMAQLSALNPDHTFMIGRSSEQFIHLKKAHVQFEWNQLISLTYPQYETLLKNTDLDGFKKAGMELTWELLTTRVLKILPPKKTPTHDDLKGDSSDDELELEEGLAGDSWSIVKPSTLSRS